MMRFRYWVGYGLAVSLRSTPVLVKNFLCFHVSHISFYGTGGFSSCESLVTKREYRRDTRESRKKFY